MALASTGPGKIWNHAVFFAYDSDINLYFLSQPSSRHMINIVENPEVAVAIFDTNQTSPVKGLQIRGQARVLADSDVASAHSEYYTRSTKFTPISSDAESYMGPAASWKFVKITPEEVGLFDRRFSEERQTAPKGIKL